MIIIMHRIKEIIIFCTGLLLCMSCANQSQLNTHLQTAIQTVDNNPQEALRLLEEIPRPEYMDHDNYMRYIVTLAQARYMNDLDITDDTLILEAQRYFAGKQEAEPAARASYYAAAYWREKETEEKEFEYMLLAHHFAKQAENNLFQAKSAHWIGSMYYDWNRLDSAKIYYHQALESYDYESNAEQLRLDLVYMLGRTYRELKQYDSALKYFNEGLIDAQKLMNQLYETRFIYCKGVIFRERKEHQQAKECFNLALSKKSSVEDSLRIYLNYAKLYRMNDLPDSAKYYLDLVKNRVEELSFHYNRLSVYRELALYDEYEKNAFSTACIQQDNLQSHIGNILEKERLIYQKGQQIKEQKSEAKIQETNERYEAYTRRTEKKYNRIWKNGLAVGFILLALLAVFRFDRQKLKKQFNKLHQQLIRKEQKAANFLPGGLWSINKCIEELNRLDLSNRLHMLRAHLIVLNDSFKEEIASSVRNIFERSHRGAGILEQLTIDELCIICLYRLDFPCEKIRYLLGYSHLPEEYIEHKIDRIRCILAEAGLKKQEINRVFQQS